MPALKGIRQEDFRECKDYTANLKINNLINT